MPYLFIFLSFGQLLMGLFAYDSEIEHWGFVILSNVSAGIALIIMEIREGK